VKVIEAFADIWCPFAHVGLRCVVERRAQLKREDAAVSVALRNALFENGVDISDPDTLSDIVRAEGVGSFDAADKQAVLADWHEGKGRGVKGSPHFFCGDADAFCPSLDIFKDGTGHLEVKRNMGVLDAFLESCFKG
jgi:2-hydroxychromene-2-carboxylate isomerase